MLEKDIPITDDTVSEDTDSVGVDCYCPNCGALYSIVERINKD